MRLAGSLLFAFGLATAAVAQDRAPLLTGAETELLAGEVSGATAKRTITALSLHHRMRGSTGYNAAVELILGRLRDYGLAEVETIRLPADGRFYGTQKSRPAWNADFAELWERRQDGAGWVDTARIASWAAQPIILAQDSVSGRADAELIDVGSGAAASDYAGKEVRGKLVLASSQADAVVKLAVTERGAAGIVSWAQNQHSAWWGDDESLVRWGHLIAWSDPAFAFMVSPAQAHAWQARLAKGETVRLRAEVKAGRTPGEYRIPTAVIPGREQGREIVLSCHLDHPSPGANDNASGCAGELEIARTLSRLIAEKKLPQPRRTIRFIWPCEIECTISLLNARPEFAKRTLATIHLDMIGGNTEITKGTLRVEGSPPSLPSFVSDVGFSVARWVDRQSLSYADTGEAAFPLLEGEGTKLALHMQIGGFSEGSDHQVWSEGSWRVPTIYLSDWPDLYIHTQKDVPGNIDPTKLRRAIFIGAASAWILANLDDGDQPELSAVMASEAMLRNGEIAEQAITASAEDQADLVRHRRWFDAMLTQSQSRFGLPAPARANPATATGTGDGAIVYRRQADPNGPMDGFGYSWFDDHLAMAGLPRPALLDRPTPDRRPSFGYETLNLVDGSRSVQQIRDDLAATVSPVPVAEVADYLATLERLGVIERKR